MLGLTALVQAVIFTSSAGSPLLADLIHNVGDALTAPIGINAFRSAREKRSPACSSCSRIFVSPCVGLLMAIQRLIDPQGSRTWALGLQASRASRTTRSRRRSDQRRQAQPALVDAARARRTASSRSASSWSAVAVALGAEIVDPIVGLVITAVILKITWDSWRVIRASEPGEHLHEHRREPFLRGWPSSRRKEARWPLPCTRRGRGSRSRARKSCSSRRGVSSWAGRAGCRGPARRCSRATCATPSASSASPSGRAWRPCARGRARRSSRSGWVECSSTSTRSPPPSSRSSPGR